MSEEHIIDEVLELIWTIEEDHGKVKKELLYEKFGEENTDKVLRETAEKQLTSIHKSNVLLSDKGRKKTKQIIRSHRIAERLLHDVLEFSDEEFERGACQFEHFINEEVIASICTLLGHPVVCPHGKNIPPGDCCLSAKRDLKPVVGPLSKLRAGVKAKVVYIATNSHSSLDRLSSIGVIPGLKLTVHQRQPSLVVQYGETQLALDKDIAKDIYVRIIHS